MKYTLAGRQSDFRNDFEGYAERLQQVIKSGDDVDREAFFKELQGDARLGIHYTPNQFSALIAHSITTNPKTILDPCCGLANILYYLENSFDSATITGIEINQNVASIAQLLVPDSNIIAADTFKYSFKDTYDLIVGNVPLGMRLKINGKSISSEEAFTLKTLELLNNNGEAFLIVGGSLLTVPRMQNTRDAILTHVNSIVKLPTPNRSFSGVSRYLIHLTATDVDEINFGIVDNFKKLKTTINQNTTLSISKKDIENRLNPEYYLSVNSSDYDFLNDFETKSFDDFTDAIFNGKHIRRENLEPTGKYLYLKPSDIQDGKLVLGERSTYLKEITDPKQERFIAHPGDIVLSTIFNQGKIYSISVEDQPIFVSNNLVILRGPENDYLKVFFETETGKKIFNTQAKDIATGAIIPHLSISNLKKIQVPVLPMDDLNLLGDNSIEQSTQEELQNKRDQVQFLKNQIEQKDQHLRDFKAHIQYLENRDDKILLELQKQGVQIRTMQTQLFSIDKKLDTILKSLDEDFKKIKNVNTDTDEKIFMLLQSLDKRIKSVLDEKRATLEEYEELTQRWLLLWDELDPTSKKFLPLAEYLFVELCNIKDADFSPFILQYCRTLENEILLKLFQKYHLEGLNGVDKNKLTAFDIENKTKALPFAHHVKKDNHHYTLGTMLRILSYSRPKGDTYKASSLLQHFRSFVVTYFQDELTNQLFLDRIEHIRQNYRNKAAHVSTLDLKSAEECRDLLRGCLNEFLELKIRVN